MGRSGGGRRAGVRRAVGRRAGGGKVGGRNNHSPELSRIIQNSQIHVSNPNHFISPANTSPPKIYSSHTPALVPLFYSLSRNWFTNHIIAITNLMRHLTHTLGQTWNSLEIFSKRRYVLGKNPSTTIA